MTPRYALLRVLLLLLSSAALCSSTTLASATSATAPTYPKLRLFTVFAPTDTIRATTALSSTPNATSNTRTDVNATSVLAMLDAAPLEQFASDFILVGTTLGAAPSQTTRVEGFNATNSAQILYQSTRWRLLHEGSDHETVPFLWARFEAVDAATATVCLSVAQWDAAWNTGDTDDHATSLLALIDASCTPADVVALALTSPAASAALTHLDPLRASLASTNDNSDPVRAAAVRAAPPASKQLVEAAQLLHRQQYVSSAVAVQSLPSVATSRLFLRMRDDNSMCADRATTLSGLRADAVAWNALVLELCSSSSCAICKPASGATSGAQASVKEPTAKSSDNAAEKSNGTTNATASASHTLVILLACGLFLAASIPVVLVVYRHQFFAPTSAQSREETELTTNLACVMRL